MLMLALKCLITNYRIDLYSSVSRQCSDRHGHATVWCSIEAVAQLQSAEYAAHELYVSRQNPGRLLCRCGDPMPNVPCVREGGRRRGE